MRPIVRFFVRYGVYADVLVVLIVGFGLVNFSQIRLSFFPELEPREIFIKVAYPGASPEEMEEGVVLKVEEGLEGIEGIEEYTSVAQENSAQVTVKGKFGTDMEELLMDTKNAVDEISSFPENAEKPVVYQRKQTDDVIELVLAGEDRLKLKEEADRVKDELLAIDGLSQIEIKGTPPVEVSVEIREDDLQRYNMTLEEVATAVGLNNRDITGGLIRGQKEELRIRSRHRSAEPDSIANIVLRARADGSLIRVRDVADVTFQFNETPNRTIFNGLDAVTMTIYKTVDEDIIFITDTVKAFKEVYNERDAYATAYILSDRSTGLNDRIDVLVENGLVGLCLVLFALGLFLNLRLALWVAIGIPISFLGMFTAINLAGYTINMISLFGMILVVGILVDDGIVIAENIFSRYERGDPPIKAAVNGTMEVIPSVFASVTTTIVAFVPFFLIESRLGEFISEMAGVVIAALAFSLVEAALILPAHVVHFKAISKEVKPGKFRRKVEGAIDKLRMKVYAPLLKKGLRYKYVSLAVIVFIIFTVAGMFRGNLIQQTFFPNIEFDNTNVFLALPPGTPVERTHDVMDYILDKVHETSDYFTEKNNEQKDLVKSTRLQLGQSENESGAHTAQLRIELLPGEIRKTGVPEFSNELRERVGKIPDAQSFSVGGRRIFGKPVSVSMISSDLNALDAAKDFLINALRDYDELRDVVDNKVEGMREIDLQLKPKAYMLGLSRAEIARQVRRGFFGREVQRIMVGTDEVKVWVRYPLQDRESIGDLSTMRIRTANGGSYELGELTNFRITRGIQQINRFDGGREIRVTANLKDPNAPVPPIIERIKTNLQPVIEERYPTVAVTYEGQAKENRKFARSATFYYPVALILMLMIITLVFRSFTQSVLVFMMIPLAVVFAFLGHWIEQTPVSLLSFYGVIALSGIVINDGVVFVDRFNRNLKTGLNFGSSLYSAGLARFRPILLTSITTVFGLYPIILETSTQAQFLIPMAISVAYGVLFVTVVILLFLPVVLSITNDVRVGLVWLWTGKRPSQTWVEPAYREGLKAAGLFEAMRQTEGSVAQPETEWPGPDSTSDTDDE